MSLPVPRWHFTSDLAAHWPANDPWPIPGWLQAGVARIVKQSPQRTVYRVDLPGLAFYLKHHHLPDRVTWVRQLLRAAKGRREFDRLERLARLGVPAPRPLGWGDCPGWLGAGESLVVTLALDDVTPLNRLLIDRALNVRQRLDLVRELGRFVAKLHDAGVDHTDLHLGNIVVRFTPRIELFLVDLDAVGLRRPLDRERSLANLVLFTRGCLPASGRADRLRFLHAYAAARGWLDPRRDVVGPRTLFDLARRVEADAWASSIAFWRGRDERCLVSNRYYRRIAGGDFVGVATRDLDEATLVHLKKDPARLFDGARVLKHSKTSTVAEMSVAVGGQPKDAIVKMIGATRRTDPLAALARPTPLLRSWIAGQGFLERNLPTPRPLAVVHRRRFGLLYEGYLLTEKLLHVQQLDQYARDIAELPDRQRRWRTKIDQVARVVQQMHRCQLSHRDLKAANLLVTSAGVEGTPAGAARPSRTSPFPVPSTNVWVIDLVGVTRHARLGKQRRVQNLARLNVSFLDSPAVTRTDRLRFLRLYLAWGVHGKGDWKPWWRAIAAATGAKVEKNKKAGRMVA